MGSKQSSTVSRNSEYNDVAGQLKPIKIGHTWTLGNFRALCGNKCTGAAVVSPAFFAGPSNRYKWRLVLYPRGDHENNKDFVSLYLQLLSDGEETSLAVKTSFSLSIINLDGKEFNKLKPSRKYCFLKGRTLWGYGRFINREQLFNGAEKKELAQPKTDSLTIFCEKSDTEPTDDVPAECNLLQMLVRENVAKTSSDLEALLERQHLSDLTIITRSGGEELRAHKAVLAARSPVFAAMFEHDMREKAENVLVVEDVRREVMLELLRFCYSGRVAELEAASLELLVAADKYALDGLKAMCEEALHNRKTIGNAVELLAFADRHDAPTLKRRIEAYIVENARQVAETKAFKTALKTHAHLIAEVFHKLPPDQ